MLVLTRRPRESLVLGTDIRVTVLDSRPEGVRLGIQAPRHVTVVRQELLDEVRQRNAASARVDPAMLEALEAAPRVAAPVAPAMMACLEVSDLGRASSFYGRLGFVRAGGVEPPFEGSALLALGGHLLCLVPCATPAPGRLVVRVPGEAGRECLDPDGNQVWIRG